MTTPFKIGDKVRFLNETGSGEITAILSDYKAVVETEDGFDYTYPISELVHETPSEAYDEVANKDVRPKPQVKVPDKWKKAHLEVDLHIEALLDDFRNMGNFEIVQYQLEVVRQKIEEARDKKVQKVILIHGVGEGILKEEVRKLLDGYANLEYHDAPFRKFGFGATEVHLRYN